jgi:hypothetical protein
MGKDKEFAQRFAEAREIGTDCIADDALEIIDTEPAMTGGDNPKYDSAHVAWLRNRAEYRLKLLAKWDPKRYGEKLSLGGDKENPIHLEANVKAEQFFEELLINLELSKAVGD